MAFTYTVNRPVYDEKNLRPGTAVHYEVGTVANGDFIEGNGIVVMCTPLVLEIELFNVHTLEFEQVSVPIEDFVKSSVVLQVLTVEDGIGSEPTGAIPTDIYPPDEVSDLRVEYNDTVNTFYWSNPGDNDFSHIKIFRDGMLLANNITVELFSENTLAPDVTYTYTIATVDKIGNESAGKHITFTMNKAGDKTLNIGV